MNAFRKFQDLSKPNFTDIISTCLKYKEIIE